MGIEKMLAAGGVKVADRLITEIVKVNLKFGKYHLLRELSNKQAMIAKCSDKREEALVKSMRRLLVEAYEQKGDSHIKKDALENVNNFNIIVTEANQH